MAAPGRPGQRACCRPSSGRLSLAASQVGLAVARSVSTQCQAPLQRSSVTSRTLGRRARAYLQQAWRGGVGGSAGARLGWTVKRAHAPPPSSTPTPKPPSLPFLHPHSLLPFFLPPSPPPPPTQKNSTAPATHLNMFRETRMLTCQPSMCVDSWIPPLPLGSHEPHARSRRSRHQAPESLAA